MAELTKGDPAPDFEARDGGGKTWRLADLRGKRVILYFYPADDTPGCTAEACDFRDNMSVLHEAGYVVLGISPQGGPVARALRTEVRAELPPPRRRAPRDGEGVRGGPREGRDVARHTPPRRAVDVRDRRERGSRAGALQGQGPRPRRFSQGVNRGLTDRRLTGRPRPWLGRRLSRATASRR